jgi:hypothetical protein
VPEDDLDQPLARRRQARQDRPYQMVVGPAPPVPDSPRSRREAARRCPTLGSCPDDAESFR